MHRYIFGIIIMILLGTFATAIGQSFESDYGINLTANPSDPEPGEEVTFTLSSYETNLDLAFISWENGNEKMSGYGEKVWAIKTGNKESGSTSVSATIDLPNGSKIQKEISVSPAQLDIAWESKNVKAPAFYLGKKIPIRENNIRVAIVNPGNKARQTAYYWSRNGKSMQSSSGTGKYFVDFKNTELEKIEDIGVSIVSTGSQISRSIKVPMTTPKILFYEYNPISGLMTNTAIKNTVSSYEDTVSLYALPLGINKNSIKNITWNLSGNKVANQENPFMLSFGKPDESGLVPVSVEINDPNSLHQEFSNKLELGF